MGHITIEEGFIQKTRQRSEFIQFLAVLAVLHQDDMKKRMTCTRMICIKG